MTVLEKQPSPELLSLIKAAAQSLLGFGELWNSIKLKGKDEGFTERELQDVLRPLLKPQLNKNQIYYLFNSDEEKERSKKTRDAAVFEREIQPNDAKKVIEQNTNSEQGSTEQEQDDDDVEFLKKRLAKYVDDSRLKEVIIENKEKEIGQLQEALKKTSFEPATEYKPPPPTFQWPEPDENNTFVFKEITFDEFRMKLGPLKAGGNTKINVYLERVR